MLILVVKTQNLIQCLREISGITFIRYTLNHTHNNDCQNRQCHLCLREESLSFNINLRLSSLRHMCISSKGPMVLFLPKTFQLLYPHSQTGGGGYIAITFSVSPSVRLSVRSHFRNISQLLLEEMIANERVGVFLARRSVQHLVWLCNLLTLGEPDEKESRNVSCALHQISTFLLHFLGTASFNNEYIYSNQCQWANVDYWVGDTLGD